jgi:hypothetical protein
MPSSVLVGGMRMSVTTTSGVLVDQRVQSRPVGRGAEQAEAGGGVDEPHQPVAQQGVVLDQDVTSRSVDARPTGEGVLPPPSTGMASRSSAAGVPGRVVVFPARG